MEIVQPSRRGLLGHELDGVIIPKRVIRTSGRGVTNI